MSYNNNLTMFDKETSLHRSDSAHKSLELCYSMKNGFLAQLRSLHITSSDFCFLDVSRFWTLNSSHIMSFY